HPAARVAAALILVAGDLALRALPADAATLVFTNLELFDDREYLTVLELAAKDPANLQEGQLLQTVLQRLYQRRLPKRLMTLTRQDFVKRFAACLELLESEKEEELPAMVYCRISQIGDGKYAKMLADKGARDDIAILELSPQIGDSRTTAASIE